MTRPPDRLGVLVVNFGEPAEPDLASIEPFLERIFLQNAALEAHSGDAAASRARELARARAPSLLEEYEEIGGSPLNRQADAQAEALAVELAARGWDARTYSCFQFTAPSIADALAGARSDGVDRVVALPVYPLCGQSTTVAALDRVAAALEEMDWSPRLACVSGWHARPAYAALRADNIRRFVEERGLDLRDPDTLLYFSIHGTPVKYLDAGNRYDRYAEEHSREVARSVGADRYAVGFQNHGNRRIAWTEPDNDERIAEVGERTLVVVPLAFMHEQSETLAELDGELREYAQGLGKEFHRVPVPHDDRRFAAILADLVGEAVEAERGHRSALAGCRCRPIPGTWCTNGDRDLPPSPFVPGAHARPEAP